MWPRGLSIVLTGLAVLASSARLEAQDQVLGQEKALHIAASTNWVVRKTSQGGRTIELQGVVDHVPLYYETQNLDAAHTVSTADVWPGGSTGLSLTGNGVTIGTWDAGRVRDTHQDLIGRVTLGDGFQQTSDHATHVAGTMLGAGLSPDDGVHPAGQSTGMAFGAELIAYDFNNDVDEMTTAAANGLRLSNHSYGLVTGWDYDDYGSGLGWYWFGNASVSMVEDYFFGFYSFQAQEWDTIAYEHPGYLIVKSAGNDRDDTGPANGEPHFVSLNGTWYPSDVVRNPDGNDGYDSLSHAATAKNVLTVGAVEDLPNGYVNAAGVQLAPFSGCGPTDDGRIKPDIVANGTELWSASSTAIDAYASRSGTSMATASVTGSLADLIEYYRQVHDGEDMSAAMLKGLVIHTADEAGVAPGPDYRFGWGQLNTASAAEQITFAAANPESMMEVWLTNHHSFEMEVRPTGGVVSFTVCWTDPPGTSPPPSLDPPDRMLVNDVDLRVIDPNGVELEPWVLDPADPAAPATRGDNNTDIVEKIDNIGVVPGPYHVQLSIDGPLVGDAQAVAFIMSNAAATGDVLGACCDGEYCSVGTRELCQLGGGTNWYGGADCSDFSCPALGACCLGCGSSATCTRTDRASCIDQGGAWHEAADCSVGLCGASGDDCMTDAIPIGDGVWPFDNRCATTDGPDVVACETGDQPFSNDLWYQYTATCTGTVSISTCGDADYDVVLAAYGDGSGACSCPVDEETQLGLCGDDTCGSSGGAAHLETWAAQGECLLIRVGGWSSASGTGNLSVSCEPSTCLVAPAPLPEPTPINKNRYLGFVPVVGTGERAAIRVRAIDVHSFPEFNGAVRWVGAPTTYPNSPAVDPLPPITVSRLQCDPVFLDWSSVGLLYVTGAEIVPSSQYEVAMVNESCADNLDSSDVYSEPMVLGTTIWGDVRPYYDAPGNPVQPDMLDVAGLVETFLGSKQAIEKPRAQLQPNVPDPSRSVDFRDISDCMSSYIFNVYPYHGPCTCPSTVPCGQTPCLVDSNCPNNGMCVDAFCRDACARCYEP